LSPISDQLSTLEAKKCPKTAARHRKDIGSSSEP
jgi:hypothetical protein